MPYRDEDRDAKRWPLAAELLTPPRPWEYWVQEYWPDPPPPWTARHAELIRELRSVGVLHVEGDRIAWCDCQRLLVHLQRVGALGSHWTWPMLRRCLRDNHGLPAGVRWNKRAVGRLRIERKQGGG